MVSSSFVSRIVAVVVAAVSVTHATPLHHHVRKTNPTYVNSPPSTTEDSCNVGPVQCCQSLHQSQDQSLQSVSGLLGLIVPLDDLMVGINCTPIGGLVGLAGNDACNSTPVCCTGNTYNGLVNIGCSPISLN